MYEQDVENPMVLEGVWDEKPKSLEQEYRERSDAFYEELEE